MRTVIALVWIIFAGQLQAGEALVCGRPELYVSFTGEPCAPIDTITPCRCSDWIHLRADRPDLDRFSIERCRVDAPRRCARTVGDTQVEPLEVEACLPDEDTCEIEAEDVRWGRYYFDPSPRDAARTRRLPDPDTSWRRWSTVRSDLSVVVELAGRLRRSRQPRRTAEPR